MKQSKVIHVFEYDKLRVNQVVENIIFKEIHFNSLVKWNEKNYNQFLDIGYNSIRFKNYVGVIFVKGLVIEVLPKAGRDNNEKKETWKKVLTRMLFECSVLKLYKTSRASLASGRASLLELFIIQYLEEVEKIVYDGLVKKYRTDEKNITKLKGKIIFSQNIKKNYIHKERFYVNSTWYDYQNIFNKILKRALTILKNTKGLSQYIKIHVKKILFYFDTIEDHHRDINWERLVFDRKTERYKDALTIARLIIGNFNPDVQFGSNNILAFLFDMNKLFEYYIYKRIKFAARQYPGIAVNYQVSKNFWSRKNIIADIVINYNNKNIVLDTKWKILRDRISADDLKQLFVYNIYWKSQKAVILYPEATGNEKKISGNFYKTDLLCNFEHRLEALPVSIIKNNLLNSDIGIEIIKSVL